MVRISLFTLILAVFQILYVSLLDKKLHSNQCYITTRFVYSIGVSLVRPTLTGRCTLHILLGGFTKSLLLTVLPFYRTVTLFYLNTDISPQIKISWNNLLILNFQILLALLTSFSSGAFNFFKVFCKVVFTNICSRIFYAVRNIPVSLNKMLTDTYKLIK